MSDVVKEGYLTKRAVRGVGSNRRRWITLRENSIEWSERQGSKPLGSMELDGETEVVVDSVTEITVEGLVSTPPPLFLCVYAEFIVGLSLFELLTFRQIAPPIGSRR